MTCECYQIGGPWITYDPNCAEHGDEARHREQMMANEIENVRATVEAETMEQIANYIESLVPSGSPTAIIWRGLAAEVRSGTWRK